MDGWKEALGNRVPTGVPLGTAVCNTCYIVLSVPFVFFRNVSLLLLISISLARSLSQAHWIISSLSFFLLPALSFTLWWVSLSFFLISLTLLYSRLLTNRTSNSVILP